MVLFGEVVTLQGSGSSTLGSPEFTYGWTQNSGIDVTLDDDAAQAARFTAPTLPTDLEFFLVVNDGTNVSAGDKVAVAVRPPLNPTEPPCVHPSGGTEFSLRSDWIWIQNHTSSGFDISGLTNGFIYDFYFCRPDGTQETLATGLAENVTHTATGLGSGTRYWWAAGATRPNQTTRWTDWVAVTPKGGASIRGAQLTSAPSSEATYRIGETIQAQVTWSQPVRVANGGKDSNVSLRLDVGPTTPISPTAAGRWSGSARGRAPTR